MGVYSGESVIIGEQPGWCEALYDARATDLLLYGRALGLSHAESEDVLQETFVVLMQRPEPPNQPEHYCLRAFRNRALNYRRSLWRRLTRELESKRWFERSPAETESEEGRCIASPGCRRSSVRSSSLRFGINTLFEEIGDLLELSPNTAAGRYRYGLQKLKACVKGAAYEQESTLERHGKHRNPITILDASLALSRD